MLRRRRRPHPALLLRRVNGLLQLNLARLEQFASGAVFCQLLDAYFKDAIPMHKVGAVAAAAAAFQPSRTA